MTPDQVEDAGWTMDQWSSLNDLARSTIEDVAQVRRIIPPGPELPNAYVVELPVFKRDPGAPSYDVDTTTPVTRIRHKFKVKSHQLHDTGLIRRLVQQVAMQVARAEDLVLAHGKDAQDRFNNDALQGSSIESAQGLLVPTRLKNADVIGVFSLAAKTLRKEGIAGTLHAAVGFDVWSELAQKDVGSNTAGPHKAKLALGSPDSVLVCLPPDPATDNRITAIGPSAGGIDLVWTLTPRLSHVTTTDGDLVLRIEEAFCLRIMDGRARTTIIKG